MRAAKENWSDDGRFFASWVSCWSTEIEAVGSSFTVRKFGICFSINKTQGKYIYGCKGKYLMDDVSCRAPTFFGQRFRNLSPDRRTRSGKSFEAQIEVVLHTRTVHQVPASENLSSSARGGAYRSHAAYRARRSGPHAVLFLPASADMSESDSVVAARILAD